MESTTILNNEQMIDLVAQSVLEHIPFNQVIGMSLGKYSAKKI